MAQGLQRLLHAVLQRGIGRQAGDRAARRIVAFARAVAEGFEGGYDLSFEQPNAIATAGDTEVRVHLRDRIEVARTGDNWTLITTKVLAPLGNLMPRLELGKTLVLAAFQWDGQTLRSVELPFNYVSASHSGGTIKDLRVTDWTGDGIDDLVLGVAISEEFWSLVGDDASQLLVYPGRP